MKIFVCLKEVAARETRYEVSPSQTWISESNLSYEISECDEYALEEALKLKESLNGEVVIVTVGASHAEKVMRKGLAMGADRGILVVDNDRLLDSPFAVAAALKGAVSGQDFDLILCGTQSDDLGYAQTSVILAELLGVPHATLVMQIDVSIGSKSLNVLREMESGWFQRLEMPYPAVLSIQAGISSIRYASLRGIMQAKKKEIRQILVQDLGLELSDYPRIEIQRLFAPESARKAELFEGDTDSAVEQLLERLKKEVKVL